MLQKDSTRCLRRTGSGRWSNLPSTQPCWGIIATNDRLTDLSFETIERRKAHEREILERIQKIQRLELSGQDLISYDLFLRDKRLNVEAQRWPTEYMPITQMG